MLPATVDRLLELNRRFYAEYGASFAATRRRIQDGVRRVLDALPDVPGERWLDLGCGSGALALEWLAAGRQSRYHGLDFSPTLLEEAEAAIRQSVSQLEVMSGEPDLQAAMVRFGRADLADPGWAAGLEAGYAGVLSFAVFHHLPSRALRLRVLAEARRLLVDGGRFYHSEWQFQHSPKLAARVLPWSTVGLAGEDLEPGDYLLDWRAPEQKPAEASSAPRSNLRYVHLFTPAELEELAAEAGFRVVDGFESDGHGGRLGLYQCWEKVA